MQLQLPGPKKRPTLNLGGVVKPDDENPTEKPKFSDYDIKILVLAILDLHMNRFKNGWFTLYKFAEKVATNPKLHDELVEFSKNNHLE